MVSSPVLIYEEWEMISDRMGDGEYSIGVHWPNGCPAVIFVDPGTIQPQHVALLRPTFS